MLEGRRETFGPRLLADSKRTVHTGERGRGPGTPRSRAVPRALVLSQASVFTGHSEIKMTTGRHGARAAETGSANGEEKPLSLEEGGWACRVHAHCSRTLQSRLVSWVCFSWNLLIN